MHELPIVALGCLLHDIGKIVQRADDNPMSRSHSRFGAEFLEKHNLLQHNKYWQWAIESVQYHHWKAIKDGNASLPIAWFAFEADNLASAHDRKHFNDFVDSDDNRLEETEITRKEKWDRFRRLDSIFSLFKSADKSRASATKLPIWFRRQSEGDYGLAIYPYPESSEKEAQAVESYQKLRDWVLADLVKFLNEQDPTKLETVNSVIHYMEENLSMVPPDTYTGHTNDVSLFDHLKLTAAIGSCMYGYVASAHPEWLGQSGKRIPWSREFRKEKAYLLVKADVSGIQDFIYNISSKAALKGLRGRSFYLELLQTQVSDHLLLALELSKANLLYQGGGGFVILAPNTDKAKETIKTAQREFNAWLFEHFRTRLYLALEYAEVTGDQLRGGASAEGNALAAAWKEISLKLTASKAERFRDLLPQVFAPRKFVAECRICYRDDAQLVMLPGQEELKVCPVCKELTTLGARLPDAAYRKNGHVAELILRAVTEQEGLLPSWNETSGKFESLSARIGTPSAGDKESCVLHNFDPFRPPKLFWSLTEFQNNEFSDLAEAAEVHGAVRRIGVLRADVDNLGKVFSGQDPSIGLPTELRSISRDAAVSRALARFFTHYLDDLLSQPRPSQNDRWAITTVYSGGDDLFLVGAWNQVIDFALLLQEKFSIFCCQRLTISAGVSIHKPTYPLYRMAEDAAEAEQAAKKNGKDALCIYFDERIDQKPPSHCFKWNTWNSTISPLVDDLNYLTEKSNLSSGFWNYLLNFVRTEQSSFYRLLYNTARLEERNKGLREDERWRSFKSSWIIQLATTKQDKDIERRRMFETALNWFILLERARAPEEERERVKQRA